jgi:hypothetical protein
VQPVHSTPPEVRAGQLVTHRLKVHAACNSSGKQGSKQAGFAATMPSVLAVTTCNVVVTECTAMQPLLHTTACCSLQDLPHTSNGTSKNHTAPYLRCSRAPMQHAVSARRHVLQVHN